MFKYFGLTWVLTPSSAQVYVGVLLYKIADGQIVIPPTQRDYNRLKYLKVSATIKKYAIMQLTFLSAILLQKHI